MALGSWALVQDTPSLLGLIPLLLYIVLAFVVSDNMIIPLGISVFVGCIMAGQGGAAFGKMFTSAMGSLLGAVGFLAIMGTGLGAVMNKAGVTTTLCKWLVKIFRINSKLKALWFCAIMQLVLTICVGSALSSAAICFAFLIPIAALFNVHPVSLAIIEAFPGFAGMLLSPFSAPNITAMEITGMDFITFELQAALPFSIGMVGFAMLCIFYFEKKLDKDKLAEVYELGESEKNFDIEVTPTAKRATIGFIIGFFASVAWVIKFGGGTNFTIFYFVLLTVIVSICGKIPAKQSITEFFEGGSKMIQIFVVCVLSEVMINTINIMGGFDALGEFFMRFVTPTSGKMLTVALSTLVGAFGINGVASTQIIVIDQLFGELARSQGVVAGMWALVLLLGSYLTVVLYPSSTHFAALGLARSKDMKRMLITCWVTSIAILIVSFIYFAIATRF